MKVLTLEMIQKKTAIEQNNRTRREKKRNLRKRPNFNSNENIFDSSDPCASVSNSSSFTSEDSSLPSSPSPMHMQHKQYNNSGRTRSSNKNKNKNFKKKRIAMDCEMVGIGYNGQQSMLARVTIIDENCKVLFDKYVKPTCKITEYRTFVSGILPEHLDENGSNAENLLDIATCRSQVLDILRNKILVGHALKNDLNALDIFHPWHQIRDTAQWGPFMKVRFNDGIYWPRKLKELVRENLSYEIQRPGKPHCPYEDAMAALQLYQYVQQAWEQEITQRVYNKPQYTHQQSNNAIICNRDQCQHSHYNHDTRQ